MHVTFCHVRIFQMSRTALQVRLCLSARTLLISGPAIMRTIRVSSNESFDQRDCIGTLPLRFCSLSLNNTQPGTTKQGVGLSSLVPMLPMVSPTQHALNYDECMLLQIGVHVIDC